METAERGHRGSKRTKREICSFRHGDGEMESGHAAVQETTPDICRIFIGVLIDNLFIPVGSI